MITRKAPFQYAQTYFTLEYGNASMAVPPLTLFLSPAAIISPPAHAAGLTRPNLHDPNSRRGFQICWRRSRVFLLTPAQQGERNLESLSLTGGG